MAPSRQRAAAAPTGGSAPEGFVPADGARDETWTWENVGKEELWLIRLPADVSAADLEGLKLRIEPEAGVDGARLGSFEKAGEDDGPTTYDVVLSGEQDGWEAESLMPFLRDGAGKTTFSCGPRFARHLVVNRAVDTSSFGSNNFTKVDDFAAPPYSQLAKFGNPVVPYGSDLSTTHATVEPVTPSKKRKARDVGTETPSKEVAASPSKEAPTPKRARKAVK